MRIVVIADVHGNGRALCRAVEQQPTASTVVFLGDGLRQAEDAAERYPDRTFYMVPGNCDLGSSLLPIRQETLGGRRFYFTHGHLHDVKYGLYRLEMAAREAGAQVVLFGHTHRPFEDYVDGLYMLNPGSLRHGGTYGYVDVTPSGVMTGIVTL